MRIRIKPLNNTLLEIALFVRRWGVARNDGGVGRLSGVAVTE
jgi:hypothetical protein